MHSTFSNLVDATQGAARNVYLPSAYFVSGQRILAGISGGRPILYLPVSSSHSLDKKLGDYLEIRNSPERFGEIADSGSIYIELLARHDFDLSLFASLAQFVVNNLPSNEFDKVIEIVELAVRDFHEMLKIAVESGLEQAKLVGLWGELWVLDFLISVVGRSAVMSWRGPLRGRHDFVLAGSSLEVKTSTVTAVKTVEIHGLSQLEKIAGKPLYLCLVQLDWDPAGLSIGDLIARINERLSVAERADFLKKLMEIGVGDDYVSTARDAKFSLHLSSAFEVDESFPRISNSVLEKEFGAGVPISDVSYRLSLDGRVPIKLAELDLSS
jgi:hypothetical protein